MLGGSNARRAVDLSRWGSVSLIISARVVDVYPVFFFNFLGASTVGNAWQISSGGIWNEIAPAQP